MVDGRGTRQAILDDLDRRTTASIDGLHATNVEPQKTFVGGHDGGIEGAATGTDEHDSVAQQGLFLCRKVNLPTVEDSRGHRWDAWVQAPEGYVAAWAHPVAEFDMEGERFETVRRAERSPVCLFAGGRRDRLHFGSPTPLDHTA